MSTFLYEMLSSPLFYAFIILWFIVIIAAEKRREALFELINNLISKPAIFEHDEEPNNVFLYARGLLETFSTWFRSAMQEPFIGLRNLFSSWLGSLTTLVNKPNKPLLVVGYTISFLLLIVYLYLDTIGVVTALVSRGFVPSDFPSIFQEYGYLAIGGSLFALLVAGYVLAQLTRAHSEMSDWDQVTGLWRNLAKFIVYVLIASGLFAIVFLSLELMIGLGYFDSESEIILTLVDFASTVLTRLNVALASILLFEDGMKGFILIAILIVVAILAIAIVLDYIARPIGTLVPFLIDILYRLVLFILFVAWFIISTPILLFTSIFKGLTRDG